MSHLGDLVSALVDGQLPPTATERAHVHLANCRGCRELVEVERLMKARLIRLPAPAPGADLVGRLLSLGGPSGPLPPRPGHVPGSPRPIPVALPARSEMLSAMGGSALAGGSGRMAGVRMAGVRAASDRPSTHSPASSRPAGRRGVPRQARLAGAVLGALGVVGAGVTGLVLAGPQAQTAPGQANFGTSVVRLPEAGHTPVQVDVSLELRQNGPVSVRTAQRSDGGR